MANGSGRCVWYICVTDGCPVWLTFFSWILFNQKCCFVLTTWESTSGCSASVPAVNLAGEVVIFMSRTGRVCVIESLLASAEGGQRGVTVKPFLTTTISALISADGGSRVARQRLLPRVTVAITTPLSPRVRMPMIGHRGGVISSRVGEVLEDAHDECTSAEGPMTASWELLEGFMLELDVVTAGVLEEVQKTLKKRSEGQRC